MSIKGFWVFLYGIHFILQQVIISIEQKLAVVSHSISILPILFQGGEGFLMACSNAKLESNGDKASPCFRPFWIRNVSNKGWPIWILLLDSFKHIFISLTSSMSIPKSEWILYSTSLVTEYSWCTVSLYFSFFSP
jgi:hypothetical protein